MGTSLGLPIFLHRFFPAHYLFIYPAFGWRHRLILISSHSLYLSAIPVESYNGTSLRLTKLERRQMGAYLCIASNDVPPAVSKRVSLSVHCKYGLNCGMRKIVLRNHIISLCFPPCQFSRWREPQTWFSSTSCSRFNRSVWPSTQPITGRPAGLRGSTGMHDGYLSHSRILLADPSLISRPDSPGSRCFSTGESVTNSITNRPTFTNRKLLKKF